MKNSPIKEILIPALCLLIIGGVCTGLLAGTNLLTKEKIAEIEVQTKNEAKQAVLTDADDFSKEITVNLNDTEYTVYVGTKSGENVGVVIPVTVKSYGGALSLMVGIDIREEKIAGVGITEINDTPGLGMKAKNADFINQFTGKIKDISVTKNAPNGNEIQAITSATITSKAVTSAVNTAFEVYNTAKEGGEIG